MPNFSVGERPEAIAAIEEAIGEAAVELDRHWDAVHGRCVITLAGAPGAVRDALVAAAAVAFERLDLRHHRGAHPRIGALDVCPVVYPDPERRAPAHAVARDVAAEIARLGVPVFLYGELAADEGRRERHFFRRGGPEELARRIEAGELAPDLGPSRLHPRAGGTLLTARPPLAAFNLELSDASLERAADLAAALRESGGGLPGVRAIAIDLGAGRVQISTNVHDPVAVPLARVVEEVERGAETIGARLEGAELVGLVPAAALRGYPERVPMRGFDPDRSVIEARLESGE